MNQSERRPRGYRPTSESLETRTVLTLQAPYVELLHNVLFGSLGSQPARPNTPVAPFAATSKPTFIDPSVSIVGGTRMAFGSSDYVAPWARLNANNGFIEVGSGTTIQDNAQIIANPTKTPGLGVILGDNVYIGPGATIIGPGQIGAPKGANTSIGANAVVDHASIQAGSEVGALARIEPGIVIHTGYRVLPGADVRIQAEADSPSLGKVVPFNGIDPVLATILSDSSSQANGYTSLYQGNPATGPNAGTTTTTVFNGSLAPVEGASPNPGTGSGSTFVAGSPKFFAPELGRTKIYTSPFYPFRLIGSVTFSVDFPRTVAKHVGKQTSIRADIDQPITIGSIGQIGRNVTIHGSRGGAITIGDHLRTGDRVVISASSTGNETIGKNVNIGTFSVVTNSSLGNGVTIGSNVYVASSTVAAGAVIPDGTILINNKVVGNVGSRQ